MNEKTKWKLIDPPEGRPGDQYFHQEWNTVTEGMNLSGLMVRRQMTPAEVNAWNLMDQLATVTDEAYRFEIQVKEAGFDAGYLRERLLETLSVANGLLDGLKIEA